MTKDWAYVFIASGFALVGYIGYDKRLVILFVIGVFGAGYYFRRLMEFVEEETI